MDRLTKDSSETATDMAWAVIATEMDKLCVKAIGKLTILSHLVSEWF